MDRGIEVLMKRDIYNKLIEWKRSPRRKPLILKGARQTGKTFILKEFGKNEYENVLYFNFEEDIELKDFFVRNLKPERIIEQLSLYCKQKISPEKDLIIFDEIQASNNALNSLKYFNEEANNYHIVAAGSLLGIKMSVPLSFPVGKITILNLFPMSFPEFLVALGESSYREFLESITKPEPLAQAFHEHLIDLLRKYYYIGGMPEVVDYFAKTNDYEETRTIQKEIINTYALDFAKHADRSDIQKLSIIWEAIPLQLARENKKFIFSAINKSARARSYENAIKWLEDAGLIYRAYQVKRCEHPLKAFADRNAFKIYALDIGLLGAMADISVDILTKKNKLFITWQGAFVENYSAVHLVSSLNKNLFYWKSEGKKAELGFIIEENNKIFPLEVKAGINTKSKSLQSYSKQFFPTLLLRTTLCNLKKDGVVVNVPLYLLSYLKTFLQ